MGPFAVRELHAAGCEVTVFHRGETRAELPEGVRAIHGDFDRFAEHADALRALRPDVVLEMHALVPPHVERIRAFAGTGARAVVASSVDVYRAWGRLWGTEPGEPDPVPCDEDAPLREMVIHEDYDKTGVEAACAEAGLPVTVLRLPAVYGPGDYRHRLHPYLRRMDDGRPAILLDRDLAGWRCGRGYAEDVAHGMALACLDARAAGRTYNVGEAGAPTEAEWVERVARAAGWGGRVAAVDPELLPEPYRWSRFDLRHDLVYDTSRIRRELGYGEETDPDEALARTIAWERAHPPEQLDPAEWDYPAEDLVVRTLGLG